MSIHSLGQIPYAANVKAYHDAGTNLSVAGTTFADWTLAGQTFVKRRADTNMVFMILGAAYADAATQHNFTIRIDGTNYGSAAFTQNIANDYHGMALFIEVPGVPAGSHTISIRCSTGAGRTISTQTTSQWSLLAMECMPARLDAEPLVGNRMVSWSMQQQGNVQTINSTTYASIGLTRSFTKKGADTRLIALFMGSCFCGVNTAGAQFGVDIDGTTTDIASHDINVANHHDLFAGAVEIAGVAAGARTLTLKWKRYGTGTLNSDANDTQSLLVMEVP